MAPATPRSPESDGWISLNHAASILRREVKAIDSLVRRDKLVPVHGKGGRGGEYRLDRDSLVMLDTAARLEDLHVPRPAIKRLIERLRDRLDSDGEFAVVYAPHKEDVVELNPGTVPLRELMGTGATVEFIEPKRRRAEFERRLQLEEAPRRRGRPKLGQAWTRKKLDSAAALGDDETSVEDLAQMIGDRGAPPWHRDR
jgi:hypothetical protein